MQHRKRINEDGTIFRRGDGHWCADISDGKKQLPDGRVVTVRKRFVRLTAGEAAKALRTFLLERDQRREQERQQALAQIRDESAGTIDEVAVGRAIAAVQAHAGGKHFVYVIAAGNATKIGKANNVSARLKQLQTGCSATIRLKRAFRGGPELEAALHGIFSELSIRREWFNSCATLDAFVARSVTLDCPQIADAFRRIE